MRSVADRGLLAAARPEWIAIAVIIGAMTAAVSAACIVCVGGVEDFSYDMVAGVSATARPSTGAVASAIGPRLKAELADSRAEDVRLSSVAGCSTQINLAVFFKSRYCSTGTLIVVATSDRNSEANLDLLDYGPMTWESQTGMWFTRVQDLETNPATVIVASLDCMMQVPVVTVPYGCDARVPFIPANGS